MHLVLVLVLALVLLLVLVSRPIFVILTLVLLGLLLVGSGVGVHTVASRIAVPVSVLAGHPTGLQAMDIAELGSESLGRAYGVPDVGGLLLSPHRALRLCVVHGWGGAEVIGVVDLVVVMGVAVV